MKYYKERERVNDLHLIVMFLSFELLLKLNINLFKTKRQLIDLFMTKDLFRLIIFSQTSEFLFYSQTKQNEKRDINLHLFICCMLDS